MAEASFTVAYDGPALQGGTMPVRDLAPALIALGDIFTEASLIVYPTRAPVTLNIKATGDGSFLVHLAIEAKRAWDDIIDIFGSDTASALSNLEAIVLGGGSGVLGLMMLIKRARGRKIIAEQPSPEIQGNIIITLDDQTTIEIPAAVLTMYRSIEVRKSVQQIVAPLRREGVETVRFSSGAIAPLEIVQEDLQAFELPPADIPGETLLDQEREMVVEITSVQFVEGNKWRFTDGQTAFAATMQDDDFLARVENGVEAFRKGDMLRSRMRIIQSRRPAGGLQTDYIVAEVIEHLPRNVQLKLGDEPEPES